MFPLKHLGLEKNNYITHTIYKIYREDEVHMYIHLHQIKNKPLNSKFPKDQKTL
jgi:hypothetical protein